MVQFNDLLMEKFAGPDNPSKSQLEADFGNLAYNFFKDRAAQLVPFLLGFEIVEQEEDGSRAIGIFGCKIGDNYYYIPVFFVNNQIRGMDMIYSKKHNSFIPLQDEWCSYLVNKQVMHLGESKNSNAMDLRADFSQPNFGFLTSPYFPVKSAGDLGEIIKQAFDCWNQMQSETVKMLAEDKHMQEAFAGAISRLQKQDELPFPKTAEDSPLINFVKDTGVQSRDLLVRLLTTNVKFANAALSFYPDVESLVIHSFNCAEPKTAAEKVKVVTEGSGYMSDESKPKVVRQGFAIEDSRAPDEKSEMFKTDYRQIFSTPDLPGLYDLLLSNGATTKAWVLPVGVADKPMMLVVDDKSRAYFTASSSTLFAKGVQQGEASDLFKDAIKLEKMKPGEHYVLINDRLDAMGPICVRAVKAANDTRTEVDIRFHDHVQFNAPIDDRYFHPDRPNSWKDNPYPMMGNDIDTLQLADYQSNKLHRSGNKMLIPSNWKALELDMGDEASCKVFKPGSMYDLEDLLEKNAFNKLVVETPDRIEYFIHLNDAIEGPLTYKAATVSLVKKYGLDVEDVEDTIKEAQANIKARRLVKFAQIPTQNLASVAMPNPQTFQYGSDAYTGQVLDMPSEQWVRGVQTGIPRTRNPYLKNLEAGAESYRTMDNQAEISNLAEQASQSGQKTVFDHAAIGGLSKTYDSSAVIDTMLPDLYKALDRLGRILFLFYWKNAEFAERYGSDDLADMEDLLRSTFKSYGSLVLKLKQKAINANKEDIL